jgi:hypothetical protein
MVSDHRIGQSSNKSTFICCVFTQEIYDSQKIILNSSFTHTQMH